MYLKIISLNLMAVRLRFSIYFMREITALGKTLFDYLKKEGYIRICNRFN